MFTLVLVLLMASVPMVTSAAGRTINVEVHQVFATDSSLASDTFTYRIKAAKSSNPMPSGSTEEGYNFMISGNNSVEIKLGSFDNEGVFVYTVFQVIDRALANYSYDRRIYTLEIHVDGNLNSYLVVKYEDGKKADEIEFRNSFKSGGGGGTITPPRPTDPPPTVIPPSPTPVITPPPSPSPSPPIGELEIVDKPIPGDEREGEVTPEPDPEPERGKPNIVVEMPKTGDESNTELLNMLFAIGGMMVLSAISYLIFNRRRRAKESK